MSKKSRQSRQPEQAPPAAAEASAASAARVRELTLDNTIPFDLNGRECPAKVLRVIDGDTIILGTYLFRTRWQIRCRCARFNCAEMRATAQEERTAAARARDFASQLLLGQIIQARFGPNDKYGRALVDIVLPDGRDLCQVMISGGYAAAYKGHGDKDWA